MVKPHESHHTSKMFNMTAFYLPHHVKEQVDVITVSERESARVHARRKRERAARKRGYSSSLENCVVHWIHWDHVDGEKVGRDMRADGCSVSVRGSKATVTFADGSVMRKMVYSEGFHFKSVDADISVEESHPEIFEAVKSRATYVVFETRSSDGSWSADASVDDVVSVLASMSRRKRMFFFKKANTLLDGESIVVGKLRITRPLPPSSNI